MALQVPDSAAFAVRTKGSKTNYYLLKELSLGGYTLESGQQKCSILPIAAACTSFAKTFDAWGPLPQAISKKAGGHY